MERFYPGSMVTDLYVRTGSRQVIRGSASFLLPVFPILGDGAL
ncbi:MAG TPA: hypothetical protein PK014_06780 [Thermoanaerobaculia bacterium]|nr:hypothetical protein [Thermoanaerobaculia bacterium]HUM29856.1 hypothetical protein [Thermoanaerobaculia bacterium]HXK68131.1 hypothetical protein [Thermoanaerobaculia bacterium]